MQIVLGVLVALIVAIAIAVIVSFVNGKQNQGCLLLFLGIVLVFVQAYVRIETRNKSYNRAFGQSLLSICEASRTEGQMPSIDHPAKLLVLGHPLDTPARDWHNKLPRKWRARKAEEVDYVLCVLHRTEQIRECDYTWETVSLYRTDYEIAVVNPKNAQTVMTHVLRGKMPPDCPIKKRLGESIPDGDPPSYSDLENWLQSEPAFHLGD